MRLFSTIHLNQIREKQHSDVEWIYPLIVTQILDPAEEVKEASISLIRRFNNDPIFLKYIIKCPPILETLKSEAKDLVCGILQFEEGVERLLKSSFLDEEVKEWNRSKCDDYVVKLEHLQDLHEDPQDMPFHLFYYLAKTVSGLGLLLRRGNLAEMLKALENSHDAQNIFQFKVFVMNLVRLNFT